MSKIDYIFGKKGSGPRVKRDVFDDIKARAAKLVREKEAIDQDAVQELLLYAVNTGELYNQRASIRKMLAKRIEKGTYDPKLAPKAWRHWFDAAAKRYVREIGGSLAQFPGPVRDAAAREMAEEEEKRIRRGEVL